MTANIAEAAEGSTVRLTIAPEQGYQLTELRVVNSVFFTQEKTIPVPEAANTVTFTMPNDNVCLQPVFVDMTSIYKLDLSAVSQGTIPPGWRCTQDGNEVHEYPNTFSLGARVFNGFTGYQGKALYWRNVSAEYGRQALYPLTLEPGDYRLTFAMAAWKESPKYKVSIIDAATETVIASSDTFTATPNASGETSANLTSTAEHELEFTVETEGDYVISFSDETTAGGLHEFLLLECRLNRIMTVGIREMEQWNDFTNSPSSYRQIPFDLSGRKITNGTRPRGLYVKDGRKVVIK